MTSLFVFSVVVALVYVIFAQHPCDAVLQGDIRERDIQITHSNMKLLYSALLENMSAEEIDKKYGGGARVVYKNIPISASYNQAQKEHFYNQLRKQVNLEEIRQYSNEIIRSSVDKNVLAVWDRCIEKQGGLVVYLETISDDEIQLNIKWNGYPLCKNEPEITMINRFGAEFMFPEMENTLYNRPLNSQEIALKRTNKKSAVVVSVSIASEYDSITEIAFLPPIIEWPDLLTYRIVKCDFELPLHGHLGKEGEEREVFFDRETTFWEDRTGKNNVKCKLLPDGRIQTIICIDGKEKQGTPQYCHPSEVSAGEGVFGRCTPLDDYFNENRDTDS